MNISDAIAVYQLHDAATYQLWGYLALVGAGTATLAWTVPLLTSKRRICITFFFVVFAVVNFFMLWHTQEANPLNSQKGIKEFVDVPPI